MLFGRVSVRRIIERQRREFRQLAAHQLAALIRPGLPIFAGAPCDAFSNHAVALVYAHPPCMF